MAVKTNLKKTARRRWVATVKTDSTHPPEGLFKENASKIARTLASKKVSPKGPASGMRMLNYFVKSKPGQQLTDERRRELTKAKRLLSEIIKAKKATEAHA